MRWLPVDTAVGAETANVLVPILNGLARSARDLKAWNQWTIVAAALGVLFAAALAANGYPWLLLVVCALLVLAYGRAQRTNLLRAGKAGFWAKGARIPAEPALPERAATLLHDLRQGHRKARIRRGEVGP